MHSELMWNQSQNDGNSLSYQQYLMALGLQDSEEKFHPQPQQQPPPPPHMIPSQTQMNMQPPSSSGSITFPHYQQQPQPQPQPHQNITSPLPSTSSSQNCFQLTDLSNFSTMLESALQQGNLARSSATEGQLQQQYQHQFLQEPSQPQQNFQQHQHTQEHEQYQEKELQKQQKQQHYQQLSFAPNKGKHSMASSKESAESDSKKRKRVSRACLNCRKAHVACDHQRPCKRCVSLGLSDTCIDVPRRKRGPNKKNANKRARLDEAGNSSPIDFDTSLIQSEILPETAASQETLNTNTRDHELNELRALAKEMGGVKQIKKTLESIRTGTIRLTEESGKPTCGPCIANMNDFLKVNTKFCKHAEPTVIWNSKQLSMVSCNREFKQLLGYQDDPTFGPGQTTWSDVIHPALMFRTLESYASSVRHGASAWERDIVCVNKKGEDVAFRILLNVTETAETGAHNVIQRVTHVHDPNTVPDIIRYILDFYHQQG